MGCNKDSDPSPEMEESKPIELEVVVPESYGSDGIKLIGRVLHLNDETIKEQGFFLQEINPYAPSLPIQIKISSKPQSGNNVLMYTQFSKIGADYEVKYYIYTDKNQYLSKAIKFQYIPITLTSFSERNVNQGDLITVNGDFSKLDSNYYISSNTENSYIIEDFQLKISNDKKSLSFQIPERLGHGDEPYFTLSRNNTMPIYLGRVNVVGKLLPLNNYDVYYRDQINFIATGFKFDSKKPFSILVGNKAFSLKTHYQTTVEDLIKGQKANTFKIGYYNGVDTIYFPKLLKLNKPTADDFYFRETIAHPNFSISVNAYELERKMPLIGSNISFGDKTAYLYTTWNGSDRLTIGDVPNGTYNVRFENDHFTYLSSKKLTIQKLQVTSFSPKIIQEDQMLTITGNFINGRSYRIYSNIGLSESQPAENGKIKVFLDYNIATKIDIKKIGYYNETLKKETLIDVSYQTEFSPITYTHFSPLKGNVSTPIRLYGDGIGRAQVFFDGKWMPSYNSGKGWTEIALYGIILPGKYKIAVLYDDKWYTIDQAYEITQ